MKIPLSLSVYEHAARLIGRTPWEVSRDPDLMRQAHREAYLTYEHFPIVMGIDIYNLESEAYGCEVQEPAGNGIPAITRALYASLDDALAIRPFDPGRDGRVPMVLRSARMQQDEFPEADVRIPVAGPFSIAQNLLGLNELMMDVATRPDDVREFLNRLVEGQVRFSHAVVDAGLKVAFFESAAAPPLLSPAQFRSVELPPLKRAIQEVTKIVEAPVPCIIGGDTAPIIPEMLETGTGFLICPAETDREAFLDRMEGHPEVTVRVNLDPRLYTWGTREEILRDVKRVIALAEGRENILLGTGAIPFETPTENLLLIKEYVS